MLYALYVSIDRGAWVVMSVIVVVTGICVLTGAVPGEYLRDIILLMGAYLLGRASKIRAELLENASKNNDARECPTIAKKGGGGIDISSRPRNGDCRGSQKVEYLIERSNNADSRDSR